MKDANCIADISPKFGEFCRKNKNKKKTAKPPSLSTKPGTQTKVFGVLCPGRRPGNKNTKNLGTKFFLVPKTENRHERGLQGTDLRLDP